MTGPRWRWPWRSTNKSVSSDIHGPSPTVIRDVDSKGPTHIAGGDQYTYNIDHVNLNISLGLAQLLRRWPDAAPYVHEVASETGRSSDGQISLEDLLLQLADLNVPAEAFPPILKVSELVRKDASDQEIREAFGSLAEIWAAQAPARQESLDNFRHPSDRSADDPPGDPCLLIALDPDFYSTDLYRLSIVLYRNGRDGDPQDGGDDAMSVAEIEAWLRPSLPVLFGTNRGPLLVEFAVPPELLGTAFDQWFIPNRPDGLSDEDFQLGEKFPVVVRDIERMAPGTDRHMWERRWQLLCNCHSNCSSLGALRWIFPEKNETFRQLRASLWHADSHGKACLGLLAGPAFSSRRTDLLKAGFDAGIPAAIWLREPDPGSAAVADDRQYLTTVIESTKLCSLPSEVLNRRLQAVAEGEPAGHPGTRLSLLWADPGRTWERPLTAPEPSSNGADF